LQNREQNLELAECQFMEMLQQRVREGSNAENLNQQEMTQRVLHLEERLESDARSYAERCEVDVAGLQNFTRECENYVHQEQNVVRNCESHLNRLHHQVAEYASVNQRLESSMVLQTSQLELNEQMAQHALCQSTVETMELAKTVMVQREEVALARRATHDAEMREEQARQFNLATTQQQSGQRDALFAEAMEARSRLESEYHRVASLLAHEEIQFRTMTGGASLQASEMNMYAHRNHELSGEYASMARQAEAHASVALECRTEVASCRKQEESCQRSLRTKNIVVSGWCDTVQSFRHSWRMR
jgi:hypothetical protein